MITLKINKKSNKSITGTYNLSSPNAGSYIPQLQSIWNKFLNEVHIGLYFRMMTFSIQIIQDDIDEENKLKTDVVFNKLKVSHDKELIKLLRPRRVDAPGATLPTLMATPHKHYIMKINGEDYVVSSGNY